MTRRTIINLLVIIILAISGFVLLVRPILFQEGNPVPILRGIARVTFNQGKLVRLDLPGEVYLTKSDSADRVMADFLSLQKYTLVEQLGSGYVFESASGSRIVITRRQYSRYYSLWRFPESGRGACSQIEEVKPNENIANELRDCLPKSDWASHEKCGELLEKIVNFDDCVNAGFSILKSNPPQCATPDGRTFVQETNATWEMVQKALCACEVERVFQSHARIVKVELKDGRELTATEPVIDAIMRLAAEVEPQCGQIIMSTE
jgi:predicted NAD-dependent protein-ADP-ribosyltransferase YbiA (DUF1768 family)